MSVAKATVTVLVFGKVFDLTNVDVVDGNMHLLVSLSDLGRMDCTIQCRTREVAVGGLTYSSRGMDQRVTRIFSWILLIKGRILIPTPIDSLRKGEVIWPWRLLLEPRRTGVICCL